MEIEHPNYKMVDKELLFALINIYSSEIIRRMFSHEDYADLNLSLDKYWGYYKEKYIQQSKNIIFSYQPMIKHYIKTKDFTRARKELNAIYNKSCEWSLKYEALILSGEEKHNEALQKISNAIKIYEQSGENKYESAFYNDYADILFNKGDINCIQVLQQAIDKCEDNGTKGLWEKKKNKWINMKYVDRPFQI